MIKKAWLHEHDDHYRLTAVTLEESAVVQRAPEIDHERTVAIADLLEDNSFYPCGTDDVPRFEGPYTLHLSIRDNRLHFLVRGEAEGEAEIIVPVSPFRSIVKDYFLICESYYKAVREGNNPQVEAVDMGRRGVHNEGSEILADLLRGKIHVNFETARRLFTLISVLHLRQMRA